MLDYRYDANHQQWISEFSERFGTLLATGRFHIRENTLLKKTYIPERLIALASGLVREEHSVGRTRSRFKFRIELLEETDQLRVRCMFGKTVEWIDAKQISMATGISRSTATRRCERMAAWLIVARDTMRIVDGKVVYSAKWLISVSDPDARRRLEEYCNVGH